MANQTSTSAPAESGWEPEFSPPAGAKGEVHVWRIPLEGHPARRTDDEADAVSPASMGAPEGPDETARLFALLSVDERKRAERSYSPTHRRRYIVAHGMLRQILGGYLNAPPAALEFETGEHGKPSLRPALRRKAAVPGYSLALEHPEFHFNLSHSANLALVAVSFGGPVGVDVERWRPDIQHLAVAERFFSEGERRTLAGIGNGLDLIRGFFAAWSRKEAYLKATGFGISRGLHHFDVSLAPGLPASLIEDRIDTTAPDRWAMADLDVGTGFSAALVAAKPVSAIRLYHAAEADHPT